MELLLDLLAEIGLRDALVVEDRAELLDHVRVHLLAEVLERVRALADAAPRTAAATPATDRAAGPSSGSSPPIPLRHAPACGRAAAWPPARGRRIGHHQDASRAARSHGSPRPSAPASTTGTPALTEIGTAMSLGIGKSARIPSTCSISRTSSFTCVLARFSTSRSFGPAIAGEVERLHADLEVLHARDVHAPDEQHVVGGLDQAEHGVVELRRACRRRRSRRSPGAPCRRRPSRRRGNDMPSVGSVGAGST